ncbi:MAG TPA: hypothetical protein VES89_02950 [Candidatus Competibacteraceae bacterium]|nr:hypothetical protein [Candidatus Competibacteraceae bacterium]
MPQATQLDVAGVLQYVIVMGVELRDIFLEEHIGDRATRFTEKWKNLFSPTRGGTQALTRWCAPTTLARKKKMKDDDFLERWIPLETSLRALEDRYRTER